MGPFLTTQAFYPLLLKRKTRTVVNVSSELASISGNRSASHPLTGKIVSYCSSKAALNMRAPPALALLCTLCICITHMCSRMLDSGLAKCQAKLWIVWKFIQGVS